MGRTINAESFPIEGMEMAWERDGYFGAGNVTTLLDSEVGRPALVCGSAETVFRDVSDIPKRIKDASPVIFAANDIGVYLPQVDHLVSLHSDNLKLWAALRADKRKRDSFFTHSLDDADFNWEGLTPVMALSGYFAMQIAYLMGCEPIILCGCPGDRTRRFFDGEAREFNYQDKGIEDQLRSEMRRVPEFFRRVKSMSGFTRAFFGGIS